MNTLEDLNRIKRANDILNKGFQKLGVKPIYVESFQEPRRPNKVEYEFKPQIELLNQVSSKLKKEKTLASQKKADSQNLAILSALVGAAVLIYVCFYVYSPQMIFEKIKTVILAPNSIVETSSDPLVQSNTAEKKFVITSGIFKNQAQANKYKNDLTIRLGVPLKIIKIEDFYTIQIGPSYKEHEDVLMVFDELARYSIRNLSIKIAS